MSQIIDRSLHKIAASTGLVLIGQAVALLCAAGSRILIARFFSENQYGLYSLCLVILNFAVLIATLGFQQGTTRQIAFYRGKEDQERVQGVIFLSIVDALIASILIFVLIYSLASFISINIFHDPELIKVLRIFSFTIPFYVFTDILVSIFRGYDNIRPRVYFREVGLNSLFLLLLIIFRYSGQSFDNSMYAFLLAAFFVVIILLVYTKKKAPFVIKKCPLIDIQNKELLLFSIPLLGVLVLYTIMSWTDTLMLGYYDTSEVVGLYNAAFPLAHFIPIVHTAMGLIYVPMITGLYSKDLLHEIKKIYQIATKWVCIISLPIFLILFLFPETILALLFGDSYIQAATTLRILSLGFVVHTFFGANGMTMIVMGKIRIIMWANLGAAILNVILNAVLIPRYGINGAAIASLVANIFINAFISIRLYQLSKIHPFIRSYVLPVAICGCIAAIYCIFINNQISIASWMVPVIFVILYILIGLIIVITRSFDEEDVRFIATILGGLGVKSDSYIIRILRRLT